MFLSIRLLAKVLLVLGLCAVCAVLVFARAYASEPTPVAVCGVIDSSNSMWFSTDRPPSDSGLLRYAAIEAAVGLLGADSHSSNDAIAIVDFGSSLREGDDIVVIPPVVLSSTEARVQLDIAIRNAQYPKGSTRLDVALRHCLQLLSDPKFEASKKAVLLTTDGEPFSPDPAFSGEAQMTAIERDILPSMRANHIPIFTIGFGPAAIDPASTFRSNIEALAKGTDGGATFADNASNLFAEVAKVFAGILGEQLTNLPESSTGSPRLFPITVAEPLDQLRIVVLKSKEGISTELTDPSGAPATGLDRNSAGLWETLTVNQPTLGRWTLALSGPGQIIVSVQSIRPPIPSQTVSPTIRTDSARPSGPASGNDVHLPHPAGENRALIAAIVGSIGAAAAIAGLVAYTFVVAGRRGLLTQVDGPGEVFLEEELGIRKWLPRPPRLSLNAILAAFGAVSSDVDGDVIVGSQGLSLRLPDGQDDRVKVDGISAAGDTAVAPGSVVSVDSVSFRYTIESESGEQEFAWNE